MIEQIRHPLRTDITETEVAWCIHAYKNHRQLVWCLEHLRQHFPHARVCVIVDGDGESYADLTDHFHCQLIVGEHLFTLATCHEYVLRYLEILSQGPEPYLLRIDPDTRVWRPFRVLPAFTAVFGTLETLSEGFSQEIEVPANVQGGCLGLTHDAVEAIRRSGLLNADNCVVNYAQTWARCWDMRYCASLGSFCDDFIVTWAASQLHLPIVEASEIRSRWRRIVNNDDLRYAITHPHKLTI